MQFFHLFSSAHPSPLCDLFHPCFLFSFPWLSIFLESPMTAPPNSSITHFVLLVAVYCTAYNGRLSLVACIKHIEKAVFKRLKWKWKDNSSIFLSIILVLHAFRHVKSFYGKLLGNCVGYVKRFSNRNASHLRAFLLELCLEFAPLFSTSLTPHHWLQPVFSTPLNPLHPIYSSTHRLSPPGRPVRREYGE